MLCGADLLNCTISDSSSWLVMATAKHSMLLMLFKIIMVINARWKSWIVSELQLQLSFIKMLCGANLSNFTIPDTSGWLVMETAKHSMLLKIYMAMNARWKRWIVSELHLHLRRICRCTRSSLKLLHQQLFHIVGCIVGEPA